MVERNYVSFFQHIYYKFSIYLFLFLFIKQNIVSSQEQLIAIMFNGKKCNVIANIYNPYNFTRNNQSNY